MMDTGVKHTSKIFVAMSGGVDSSVAAAILKRAATPKDFEKIFGRPAPKGFRGFDVTGVFMKFWAPAKISGRNLGGQGNQNRCCSIEAQEDARRVAAKIGIPFYTLNLEKEFKKTVVDYFLKEYRAGCTPNPCVICNKEIKFGLLIEKALAMGADFVATGHYARECAFEKRSCFPSVKTLRLGGLACSSRQRRDTMPASEPLHFQKRIPSPGKIDDWKQRFQCSIKLLRAKDRNKDQSYFLWTLTRDKLSRILFPVGDYTKDEVRKMAKKWGLPVAQKPESQEICFIPDGDLNRFLKCHLKTKNGPIATLDGKIIGQHEGLTFYTIGQRKGIKIPAKEPYFVVDKDYESNILIVAPLSRKDALMKKELIVKNVNWILGIEPKLPLRVKAKIRYRHEPSAATLHKIQTVNYKLVFDAPQRAITPGQSVVFYRGEELLGGGIIRG